MPWARIAGVLGRVLIGSGLLLLLFVAYLLWGTGIQESRSQRHLTRDFERRLDAATPPSSVPGSGSGGTTTTTEPPLPPPTGESVAILEIPKIGVRKAVVQGVRVKDLKKGPGHYPDTPMPGQDGNAAIAGHRTTYGAPFYRLNELDPGDTIKVRTLQGEFEYEVESTTVVQPTDLDVLDQTDDARLTLTTCEPRFSARRRLVVTALLRDEPAPTPTTTTTAPPTTTPGQQVTTTTTEAPQENALDLGGDSRAWPPTILYGLLCTIIGVGAWLVRRRWRAWAYLIAAPIFFVALFFFFENISRLLPANI
jgi:sortase A